MLVKTRRTAMMLLLLLSVAMADCSATDISLKYANPSNGSYDVTLWDRSIPDSIEKSQWIRVLPETGSSPGVLELVLGVMDTVNVFVQIHSEEESPESYSVYWHAGTDSEPYMLNLWNSIYCGGLSYWSQPQNCSFAISRYGWFAPFGSSYILVQPSDTRNEPFSYNVTYEAEFDTRALILLLIGLFIWRAAPIMSHSRPLHLGAGTIMGAFGFLIILMMIAIRLVPGKKQATFAATAFGIIGVTIRWFWDAIQDTLKNNAFLIVVYLVVGGVVGFCIAYTFRPSETTQNLFIILMRLIAALFVLGGFTNLWASLIVLLVVCILSFTGGPNIVCPRNDPSLSWSDSEDEDAPVMSRAKRNEYLREQIPQSADKFIVQGAAEYDSMDDYERSMKYTTQVELTKLKSQIERGGGRMVSRLSDAARRRITAHLQYDEPFTSANDHDYDFADM